MAFPPGVELVTVSSGQPLALLDGTPLEGTITFIGPSLVTIGSQDVVLGGSTTVQLVDGQFSASLVATDATGMSPTGWTYTVMGRFSNAPGWKRYISLPKAAPSVKLADVLVPDPAAGSYSVLVDGSALLAKAENLADLPDKAQARASLGLGSAATQSTAAFDPAGAAAAVAAAIPTAGTTAGTYAAGNDSRLSNNRTPTAHAASHGSGSTDPISPASIGAVATTGDQVVHGEITFADRIPVGPGIDPAFDNQMAHKGFADRTYAPITDRPDLPADQGYLAWTYDPNMAGNDTSQSSCGVAGRITLTRIIIRKQITVSNIWLGLSGVDTGATLSNCYLGIYDTSGNLKCVTADMSSQLIILANAKAMAFAVTAPATLASGTYYIALVLNGSWTTNTFTLKCSGAGISVNGKLAAPNLRYCNMLTGQTSLPTTLNMASQATSIISTGWASQWYALD